MKDLSPKRKKFVDEYLIDFDGAKAAIRAGYSSRCAKEQASYLLTIHNVKAAVELGMQKASEKAGIKAADVLSEIYKLAMSNIKDYLSFKTDIAMTDYKGEKVPEFRQVIEVKDSDEVDCAAISEVSVGKDGTFKFKLHDKGKALEMLGRHLKLFQDNINISGQVGVQIIDDIGGDKDADSDD